jgi:hypothetical protein
MEMICPECQGTLETADGQTARCTLHQGQFRILFCHRQPPPTPAAPIMTAGSAWDGQRMCAQHPNVATSTVCARCGVAICETCAFQGKDGGKLCLRCVANLPVFSNEPAPPAVPAGSCCVQHPSVAATQQCKLCGAFMCATCDFVMPGNLHVCPVCATAPRAALSPRRKKSMIASYVLAAVATLGMGAGFSGLLAGSNNQERGMFLMFFGLVPALAGMGMGFSAINRRLTNPMSLWIATIWNSVFVAGWLLLSVIGIMMK